jgi:feruloyl esterase
MRHPWILLSIAMALPAAAQRPCAALPGLAIPKVTITAAAVAGARTLQRNQQVVDHQPFCRVTGFVAPEVNFALYLPENWNGKFLMVGNGGLAGTISYAAMIDPLLRGYATASTDTGHQADNDGRWAAGHMQRVIDFAHRAVHVTALAAKAIIAAHYGRAPAHSYFQGCSQGGQQALTEVQRYPEDFDGVIAGDPANYWTHLYMGGHIWIAQATLLDDASYIPAAKTAAIGNAVNAACDALDGIKDGILNDPRRCHFDPASIQCRGADAPDCLTAAQVAAARKIFQGARLSDGTVIFPGILPGGEAGPGGWARWITGTAPGRGAHMTLGFPFMRYIAFEDPNWDFRSFRFERSGAMESDVEFIDAKLGPIFDNMNPDIRAFQARGGKLIQYHGWSDPDISPLNSVHYYESVVARMGRDGLAQTRSFYRLFMVPGMQHCSGGPGPDTFDALKALEDWVERGAAPDRIVATHATNGVVDRSRPLCPYPMEARWTGRGSTDQAENFACALPAAP